MNKTKDSDEVTKRLNQQIRTVEHGTGYYFSLFLLVFAIPLFILLEFFYPAAGGWTVFDVIFVLILLAFAIRGIYGEIKAKRRLPLWFIVLGVISGIVITIVTVFINTLR